MVFLLKEVKQEDLEKQLKIMVVILIIILQEN
jgi:hypothetical protein